MVLFDYLTKIIGIGVVVKDDTSSLINEGGLEIIADSLEMVKILIITWELILLWSKYIKKLF